ncbi:Morphology and auto-aggregation control protein [Ruegeria denitrificans]|uniref:Morphology and auto-aggregation control protein n=1 Tax=Ruegeria denitrificans TaxID=1715692 RepID=A0A0P1IVB6_9RHOB|nr:LysR substrate-binding domain-containing protein [Ruegeria denitrificans]CUK10325.1 Morphology and auto-aggregation control protein [Ruegeria denitrificans]
MSVSFQSMRYFTTAVSLGSISKAADELNVAASAVSAAIDKIEDQFQLKLINRFRSRGITATASGRVLNRKFSHLLEEYAAVMEEGAELKQAMKGTLRVGYYAPVAPAFLPEILTSLMKPDDQITLYLEECDNDSAQEGLLAGKFDAILFVSDAALPQITFDVLIEAPAYCLTASNHPLAQQETVSLRDLAQESLIVLNRPTAVDYYRRLFGDAGQDPQTIAYVNSTEMVRSLVGAGHGCAVLNMLPLTVVSYAGQQLAALPIRDALPPLSLALGYDKTNPRRIVSKFANQCRFYFDRGAGHRHIVAL